LKKAEAEEGRSRARRTKGEGVVVHEAEVGDEVGDDDDVHDEVVGLKLKASLLRLRR